MRIRLSLTPVRAFSITLREGQELWWYRPNEIRASPLNHHSPSDTIRSLLESDQFRSIARHEQMPLWSRARPRTRRPRRRNHRKARSRPQQLPHSAKLLAERSVAPEHHASFAKTARATHPGLTRNHLEPLVCARSPGYHLLTPRPRLRSHRIGQGKVKNTEYFRRNGLSDRPILPNTRKLSHPDQWPTPARGPRWPDRIHGAPVGHLRRRHQRSQRRATRPNRLANPRRPSRLYHRFVVRRQPKPKATDGQQKTTLGHSHRASVNHVLKAFARRIRISSAQRISES